MKPKTLKITALLLIIAGVFTACNGKEPSIENFPKEISFTEFSLADTSCNWRVPWELLDDNNEKVIVINSQQELSRFIICDDYPVIDFSTYSLLLLYGLFRNDIINVSATQLQQVSASDYLLNIEVIFGFNRSVDSWITAILVPKISNNANIKLDVQRSQEVYEKIIGRWEHVAIVFRQGSTITTTPVQPRYYMEFFPDGRMRIFDYATETHRYGTYELRRTWGSTSTFRPWLVTAFWELHSIGLGRPLKLIHITEEEKISQRFVSSSPPLDVYKRKQ